MPEPLQIAMITFVVTILTTGTVLLRWLPGVLERREKAFEAKMKTERQKESAAIKIDVEESRATTIVLTSMSKNLEAATDALIAQTKYTEVFQRQFVSNEKAIVENTEALGMMAEHFGVLLQTGSKPLQKMLNILQDIEKEGTEPLQKLQTSVNEIKSILTDEVAPSVAPAGIIITALGRIEAEWQEIKTLLQSRIQEAVEEKHKTGPLPRVEVLPENAS